MNKLRLLVGLFLLVLAGPARADNYAVLFAGGVEPSQNPEMFYKATIRMWRVVVNHLNYPAENVYVLAADGTGAGRDQQVKDSILINSDWSEVTEAGGIIRPGTRDNLRRVLSELQEEMGPDDVFYFWSDDHGYNESDFAGFRPGWYKSGLCAWIDSKARSRDEADISCEEFAEWTNDFNVRAECYAFGQCFSGGMIHHMGIGANDGRVRFAAWSASYDETALGASNCWTDAWVEALIHEPSHATCVLGRAAVVNDRYGPYGDRGKSENPGYVGDNFDLTTGELVNGPAVILGALPVERDTARSISFEGDLARGDFVDENGWFYDSYVFEAKAGDRITCSLVSDDFDSYLTLISPEDVRQVDDDSAGNLDAVISFTAESTGEYRVMVSAYRSRLADHRDFNALSPEQGCYVLDIQGAHAGWAVANPDLEVVELAGRLKRGDRVVEESQSYYDLYGFAAEKGDHIAVDLLSDDFDGSLLVYSPTNKRYADDQGGEGTNAALSFLAESSGNYRVLATSFESGQSGHYQLRVAGGRDVRVIQQRTNRDGELLLQEGSLDEDDEILTGEGSYYDLYTFQANYGDSVDIDLMSEDFNAYIICKSPLGQRRFDDNSGDGENAHLGFVADASGAYRLWVNSFAEGEEGAYDLAVRGGSNLRMIDPPTELRGRLNRQSARVGGKYFDFYRFTAEEGDFVALDLISRSFDCYLIVRGPTGEQMIDDDGGADSNASLSFMAEASGVYQVLVTSYSPREQGRYTLRCLGVDLEDSEPPVSAEGFLAADNAGPYGNYRTVYSFSAEQGSLLAVDLMSTDFDTYLVVRSPSGQEYINDDAGTNTNSSVTMTADATGVYQVVVSSFEEGETGDFELAVFGGADLAPVELEELAQAGKLPGLADKLEVSAELFALMQQPSLAVVSRAGVVAHHGRLEAGDEVSEDGSYYDVYDIEATAGDQMEITLVSDDFDAYLTVEMPSGQRFTDDDGGNGHNSCLPFSVRSTGQYRIIASSYGPRETGEYDLQIETFPTGAVQTCGGQLERGDETRDQRCVDWYDLHAAAGDRIRIDLVSDDFDAYLIVVSPSGREYTDDDSGTELNARLSFTADVDGLCHVGVSSYEPEYGSYELRVLGGGELRASEDD
ncbi:MAG: PPC domain-containing protein [Sedimentisphaerales bacterium]|nr:PPC domain-containing protein [Sedimentisphaerales bacterium]